MYCLPLILLTLRRLLHLHPMAPETPSKVMASMAVFAGVWNTLMISFQRRYTISKEGRLVTHSQVTCEVETEDCNPEVQETLMNV